MVFDAAFLAGTVASLMMNGACCYYQSNREDELREELRDEIRREWHIQRKREKRRKLRTTRDKEDDVIKSSSSEIDEERYRELIMIRSTSSEEHPSFAEKRNDKVSGSSCSGSVVASRVTAPSVYYSTGTPYPPFSRRPQDPPSVNDLLVSRTSSILHEDDVDIDEDEDEEDVDINTNLMFVTDAGSDIGTLEDISIKSD